MFCSNCGSQIGDNYAPCPYCGHFKTYRADTGSQVNMTDPNRMMLHLKAPEHTMSRRTPAVTAARPTPSYRSMALASSALRFGILSLALGWIFGIIFGIMAKNRANDYLYYEGNLSGKARTGHILGTVGFIVGIVQSVLLLFYWIFLWELLY